MTMFRPLYANAAVAVLGADLSPSDTTLTVGAGEGARFPAPPAFHRAVLVLQQGDDYEIVHLTARSGDVLTIVRGQEGTTPRAFVAGVTSVEMRVTAGVLTHAQTAARAFIEPVVITSGTSLTPEQAGSHVVYAGVAAATVALPVPATVPLGTRYALTNISAAGTVSVTQEPFGPLVVAVPPGHSADFVRAGTGWVPAWTPPPNFGAVTGLVALDNAVVRGPSPVFTVDVHGTSNPAVVRAARAGVPFWSLNFGRATPVTDNLFAVTRHNPSGAPLQNVLTFDWATGAGAFAEPPYAPRYDAGPSGFRVVSAWTSGPTHSMVLVGGDPNWNPSEPIQAQAVHAESSFAAFRMKVGSYTYDARHDGLFTAHTLEARNGYVKFGGQPFLFERLPSPLGHNVARVVTSGWPDLIVPFNNTVFATHVDGGIVTVFDGGGTAHPLQPLISDRRLKENIAPAAAGHLDVVRRIPLRSFRLKAQQRDVPVGFVAQEAQEVDPALVVEAQDVLLMDALALNARLVGAVQELAAMVERLSSRVAELEARRP